MRPHRPSFFFFFNDTATTEIYTLSLHDALPIYPDHARRMRRAVQGSNRVVQVGIQSVTDRKSTRLNSSHSQISYAVFCLKKKKHDRTNRGYTEPIRPRGPHHPGRRLPRAVPHHS